MLEQTDQPRDIKSLRALAEDIEDPEAASFAYYLIGEVEQLRARLPRPGRDSVSQLLSDYNGRMKDLRRENGKLKHRLAELGVHDLA